MYAPFYVLDQQSGISYKHLTFSFVSIKSCIIHLVLTRNVFFMFYFNFLAGKCIQNE